MNKNSTLHLWFSEDSRRFFLIPERARLAPGTETICDLLENRRLVAPEALAGYACSLEEGQQHLHAAWQEALERAKQAWLDLANFAERSGQGIDNAELGRQFQEGLQAAGPEAQEIFATGRDLVESILQAANEMPQLSDAEAQVAFKRAFAQLPEIMEQFSEAALEMAAADPEAWADNLYRQVFGEQEQRKLEQRKQELAEDIRASIEAGLVAAGMKPLADL